MRYILLAFVMNGCSVYSFLGGVKQDAPLVVVEVPPNRIGYGGVMDKYDRQLIRDLVEIMVDEPYNLHNFTYPLGVGVNIDRKKTSDISFSGSSSVKKRGL